MAGDRSIRGYVGEFVQEGVVVVEDFLDADDVARYREAAEELARADLPRVDADAADWSPEGTAAGDGPRVVGDPGSAGTARVVDAHETSDALDELRDNVFVEALANGPAGEFYAAERLDVVLATGPTDPPTYRSVGEGVTVAVVYLTDVTDAGDGPYAYIHGSHRESGVKRAAGNLLGRIGDLGTGEATFHDEADGTAHVGPAGTLVVADGRGYGRYLPVADGRERVVAEIRYRPAAEASTVERERPKYADPETGARRG